LHFSSKHDQYVLVDYRWRWCNGKLEIEILKVTTVDNADSLKRFKLEHYEFSLLKSVIELGVMIRLFKLASTNNFDWNLGDEANCNGTAVFVSFILRVVEFLLLVYIHVQTLHVSVIVVIYPHIQN